MDPIRSTQEHRINTGEPDQHRVSGPTRIQLCNVYIIESPVHKVKLLIWFKTKSTSQLSQVADQVIQGQGH